MLIRRYAPDRDQHILDAGAGASVLVDGLLTDGYNRLTIVDISARAIDVTRGRLGDAAGSVSWLVEDILMASLPAEDVDVWHDRATFHFLTEAADRELYVSQVRRALRPGGYVVVATFAEDGPVKCSGLDVARYSPARLSAEFGRDFELVDSASELHYTPSGGTQAFTYYIGRYHPYEERLAGNSPAA